MYFFVCFLSLIALNAAIASAESARNEPKAIELFNGKDLTGWVNVNCALDTWSVRDGMIVATGHPRGILRSEKMYENYILEAEWRHVKEGGNAGIFVHADALPQVGAPYTCSVEVQVMDGDHGSMFGIRGCKTTPLTNPRGALRAQPLEQRAKPAGQWNNYRLTSRDGALDLEVNGRLVTKVKDCSQVKGYICLESEGSEVHFRNLRLTPLPSSNPPPDKVARDADGFVSLFDGLSFDGWKYIDAFKGHWVAADGVISCDGRVEAKRGGERNLWTQKEFADFVLVADWRLPQKPVRRQMNDFTDDGFIKRDKDGKVITHEILHAGDSGIFVRGNQRSQVNIWSQPMGSGDINDYHKDAKMPVEIRRATLPKVSADNPPGQWNRFIITMRGDRITVVLNGQTVIDNAKLPGVPDRGAIGLQNHGDPVEFRNLFIKGL
ncbi:DUF1080 domain-containing protein [Candidatus Sumerlaeota bacterium]|nr:DUF1080 domain-containing protein [Candidatus Sumerlaeota bacterium]